MTLLVVIDEVLVKQTYRLRLFYEPAVERPSPLIRTERNIF